MNKTSGRILSVLLAILLSVAALPAQVFAIVPPAPNVTAEDFTYETYTEDGVTKLALFAYFGSETAIVFPDEMDGLPIGTIGGYLFFRNSTITSVIIPEGVTEIGDFAFSECASLETVIFPEGKFTIGTNVFMNSEALTPRIYDNAKYFGSRSNPYKVLIGAADAEITSCAISADTEIILDRAFLGCDLLTSVVLPEGITAIGMDAFVGCTSLSFTTYENAMYLGNEANPHLALISATNTEITSCTIHTGTKILAYSAFLNCRSLTSIAIPEGITSIGAEMFASCDALESVVLPESLKTIGWGAFHECTALESINFPEGLTTIKPWAFFACVSLTDITLPEGLITLGEHAFRACLVKSVVLPASLVSIQTEAFAYCHYLESITVASGNPVYHSAGNCLIETASKTLVFGCKNSIIPADGSVTEIGCRAFQYCINLSEITIPEGITTIGEDAFSNCMNLAAVSLPGSLTTIGKWAFENCTFLVYFAIPVQITEIVDKVFDECAKLESITIPPSVNRISTSAFDNCTKLRRICGVKGTYAETYAIAKRLTFEEIGASQPVSASLESGEVSYDSKLTLSTATEGADIYYTTDLSNPYNQANPARTKYEGPIAITEDVEIIAYATKTGYLDSQTTSFSYSAAPNVTAEDITYETYTEDGVTKIGITAYVGTETALFFPNEIDGKVIGKIGMNAFMGNALESVILPENLTVIDGFAFSMCASLKSVTLPEGFTTIGMSAFYSCTSLASINLPESLTSIGAQAFYGCTSLANITLPESLTSIGTQAFYECTSLAGITLPAGLVSIGAEAFTSCPSLSFTTYDNAKYLGNEANPYFALCQATLTNITSCTVHADTKILVGGAFRDCASLTSITLPAGVTSIGSAAFQFCNSLASISIPESVTELGMNAFDGCVLLSYTTYDNAKYLGNEANPYFALIEATSTGITSCIVHDDTKILADGAFYTRNITSIILPEGVISIGAEAFFGSALTSITLPRTLATIGASAFYECAALTSITLPEGVRTIGDFAFFQCSQLASISFVECAPSIGVDAFVFCDALQTVYGVDESFAETFATEHGYTFVVLAARPVIASVSEGNVYRGTMLTLSTQTRGADIYYTTDSSDPGDLANTARTKYEAPIVITEDVVIKACTTKTGYQNSPADSFAYTVPTFGISGTVSAPGGMDDVSILLYSPETTDAEILADMKTNNPQNALTYTAVLGEVSSEGDLYSCPFFFAGVPAGAYKLAVHKEGNYTVQIVGVSSMETVIDAGEIVIDFVEAGDVDGNGEIGMEDLVLLAKYLANWDVTVNATGAMVSGETNIGMSDLLLLAKYLANWDVTLGA